MKTTHTSTSERDCITRKDAYWEPNQNVGMNDRLFEIPDPDTFGADGYVAALGVAAFFLDVILRFCWSKVLGYFSAKLVRRSSPDSKHCLKVYHKSLNSSNPK